MASGSHPIATYTVAWIAALPHERAAALELLDDEHRRPKDFKKNVGDRNSYSWGRIGDHNVVVASLPDGVYGTTTAAVTAARLVSSLPHIRLGLLVGIGAGITGETRDENGQITLKNDVLLGDVVVSKPTDGNGGVVLHDVTKAKVVDGKRKTLLNGHLNQPPDALLHALGALRAQHLRRPSKMQELLAVFEKNEMMRDTFVYPGEGHDPVRTALSSSTTISKRNLPKIHYGIIASGNELIKDAAERDDIISWLHENKVEPICFEMEAGGLMNNFPCIVIRGICDYADERKNDTWQHYAAATAAAFAKEFLDYLDVDEVEDEDTLATRLEELQSHVQDVKTDTSRLVTSASENEMRDLQNWICSTDYTPRLHEHQSNYLPGTASWFFEHGSYRTWIEHGLGSVLLCEGHPGTGKSTLTSHVVEVLQERCSPSDAPVPVLYFFFNHMMHQTQTADHVLCSLLRQLIRFLPEIPHDLWKAMEATERLTLNRTYSFLHTVMSDIGDLFLILDGLDEASPGARDDLIPRLCTLTHDHKVHFLTTSRCLPTIQKQFEPYPCLEVTVSMSDVETYVRRRMSGFADERMKTPHLVNATVVAVSRRCSGMFLLARLLMDILVARVATPSSLKRALQSLPSGEDAYGPAYDSILARITSQQGDFKDIGLECLAWIVFAKRPLTLAKLGHALATRSSDTGFDPEDVPQLESLPSVCAGLIVINHENNIVSLVHTTAYEYLVAVKDKWFPKAEFFLADRCLKYLISASTCMDLDPSKLKDYSLSQWENWAFHEYEISGPAKLMAPWPFLHYAATEWPRHAKDVEMDNGENGDLIQALSSRIATLPAKQQWWFWTSRGTMVFHASSELFEMRFDHNIATISQFTIWHCMVRWDLAKICKAHLARVEYTNSKYLGRTPLILAAEYGSTETARVLLNSTCAQPDETRGHARLGHTVLWLAAHCGMNTFVEMLLAEVSSLDCNTTDSRQRTPLMTAALRGHSETVKILLKSPKVDVSLRDKNAETLLSSALKNPEIVQTLLPHPRINVNECVRDGSTALIQALAKGRIATAKLLLSHPDIDVNTADGSGKTPLLHATNLSADPDIDVNKADGWGNTPLSQATNLWAGRNEVVRMLLSHPDIDVNKADGSGNTPLVQATSLSAGRDEIVRMLLSHPDIDVNKADGSGKTPLLHATGQGILIVQTLLSHPDIDVNKADGSGTTPLLQVFTQIDYYEVIARELLSHPDIDVNKSDGSGTTALLQATSTTRHKVVRELLLNPGIDVNKLCGCECGDSALHLAAMQGKTEIVRMLLSHSRIDLNKTSRVGDTALVRAIVHKRDEVIRLLLQQPDIGVNDLDCEGSCALTKASRGGHTSIVEILLESAAVQLDVRDVNGHTPLADAAFLGHTDVVRMLIAKGADVSGRCDDGVMALFVSAVRGKTSSTAEMLGHVPSLDQISLTPSERKLLRAAYSAALVTTQNREKFREVHPTPVPLGHEVGGDDGDHADPTGADCVSAISDLQPGLPSKSLMLLRQIPAVRKLFEHVEKMTPDVHVTDSKDQKAIRWYFQNEDICAGVPLISCDCNNPVRAVSAVFWVCSRCEPKRNHELEGQVFLPCCIEEGAWCQDHSHSMKKVNMTPLVEGDPAAFVYPFPDWTYQAEEDEKQMQMALRLSMREAELGGGDMGRWNPFSTQMYQDEDHDLQMALKLSMEDAGLQY